MTSLYLEIELLGVDTGVGKIKMEEVLFRLQRQESRSLTWLLTSLDSAQIPCLPTSTASQLGL